MAAPQAGSTIIVADANGSTQLDVPDDDAPTWDVDVTLEPMLDE